jgi:predicted N-formylglutamate amidohydrolase
MSAPEALIGPGDPPPFETLNEEGAAPLLLICDHASCAVPAALDDLGLDRATLEDHIGWDIGAAAVTRRLSLLLDAPAVLAGYSRLVIDCNRPEAAPDLVPPVADGRPIPGNQNLSAADIAARRAAFFEPYHQEILYFLDKFSTAGLVPLLAAIHSFTPAMTSDAEPRPWVVSICWDRDGRVALPMLAALREEGLCVGENQPYGFDPLSDYAIPEYGLKRGLPHILVELRNDQVRDAADIDVWSDRLAHHLTAALADPATHRIEHF